MQLTGSSTTTVGTPWLLSLTRWPSGVVQTYVLDVSVAGTTPGLVIPCWGTLPLNPPYLNMDYGALFPGVFNNFIGSIGPGQTLQEFVNVPAFPILSGFTLSACALTLDSISSTGLGLRSNSVSTLLQ